MDQQDPVVNAKMIHNDTEAGVQYVPITTGDESTVHMQLEGAVPVTMPVVFVGNSSALPLEDRPCQCCYPVTALDVQLIRPARTLAIIQVVMESTFGVGTAYSSGLAIVAALIGIPVTSVVACCSKTRAAFLWWGILGLIVTGLHLGAALHIMAVGYHTFNAIIQATASLISFAGATTGFMIASAVKRSLRLIPAQEN